MVELSHKCQISYLSVYVLHICFTPVALSILLDLIFEVINHSHKNKIFKMAGLIFSLPKTVV